MIPTEIVVGCLIIYLVFRLAQWWARARTLDEENAKLHRELDEAHGNIVALSDQLEKAQRPASSGRAAS